MNTQNLITNHSKKSRQDAIRIAKKSTFYSNENTPMFMFLTLCNRNETMDLTKEIAKVRKSIDQDMSMRVTPLLNDLSELEIKMPVLAGDYALKKVRQEYLAERLEKVNYILEMVQLGK
jgi:hypothetical protein